MRKAKSILMCVLLALLGFSCVFTVNNARGEIIGPYEGNAALTLSVTYSGGSLMIDTIGGTPDAYKYQYWVKKKVDPGEIDNKETIRYIWQIVRGYQTTPQYSIAGLDVYNEDDNPYVDEFGRYNVIARVQDAGKNVIDELYGVYTSEEIGEPIIESVTVNGDIVGGEQIVVSNTDSINIGIKSNLSGVNYTVTIGEDVRNSLTENFTFDIGSIKAGQHIIEASIEKNGNTASRKIKLYVIEKYLPSERPMITSLTGTENVTDGNAELVMKIAYADETEMTESDLGKFNYKLSSGGILLNSKISDQGITEELNADGGIDVTFEVDYGEDAYGIYYTIAEVSRLDVSGADDIIRKYYDGYARDGAEVTQQTNAVKNGNIYQWDKQSEMPLSITGVGDIPLASGVLTYAFYREDAAGWTQIRNYGTSPTLNWEPTKSGTYNIQVRIKDSAAGSYEASATNTYVVSGGGLEGNLDIKFYDYAKEEYTDTLIAGKAYRLEADYKENFEDNLITPDDVLYMFTLRSDNLSTIYLNKFNPDKFFTFVPSRPDSYKITARVIRMTNFGYKDIALTENIECVNPAPYYLKLEEAGVYYIDYEDNAPLAKLYRYSDDSVIEEADIGYQLTDAEEHEFDIIDGKIALPYGQYTLTSYINYNGLPLSDEISFSVLTERKLKNAFLYFDGEGDLGMSGTDMTSFSYKSDFKRTPYSDGTLYFETAPNKINPNFTITAPLMSKEEFTAAMDEEGAYLSIWLYVTTNVATIDLRFQIGWSGYLLRVTDNNQWHQLKITKQNILDAGDSRYNTPEKFYDFLPTRFMFLNNLCGGDRVCKIYFDSMFVAKDGEVTIDMPVTEFEAGQEIEIVASSSVKDLIYKVSAGAQTQYYATNKFIPWGLGTTQVTVMSKYGDINASATINLNITAERKLDDALIYFDGEGDSGFGLKSGSNVVSTFSSQVKRLPNSDGSVYVDFNTNGPNIGLTVPIMSKTDFVAKMNEPGAYLSMWIYIETVNEGFSLDFRIGWIASVASVTAKNQWVNLKLTKAMITQENDGRYNTLESYYDFMATRFMFLNNNLSGTLYRIYFDSIFVAKDGDIAIDMPNTEYSINDEIQITATSEDVDKLIYEVTLGGETRYFTEPTFTPWAAGAATVTVRSAYGNVNAAATINLTITP